MDLSDDEWRREAEEAMAEFRAIAGVLNMQSHPGPLREWAKFCRDRIVRDKDTIDVLFRHQERTRKERDAAVLALWKDQRSLFEDNEDADEGVARMTGIDAWTVHMIVDSDKQTDVR
jgi:hypothetical protein